MDFFSTIPTLTSLNNTNIDDYSPIRFESNQKYEDNDKIIGYLGTYTVKHVALASHSKETNKTFFLCGICSKPYVIYMDILYLHSTDIHTDFYHYLHRHHGNA
jgi:hypothetical protein